MNLGEFFEYMNSETIVVIKWNGRSFFVKGM